MDMKDKVVLITGAAGGIGRAAASRFAAEGAKLVLVDFDADGLKKTVSDLHLQEDSCLTVTADVSKEDDVKNYVTAAKERYSRIDVFFNNAGIEGPFSMIKDTSAEDFDKVQQVNVRGVFLGLKYVIPVMEAQQSGSIINTSSVAGLSGSPGMSPYVTSKHAVIGLTKTAALEVAEAGIRVNSIHPSPINTRMMRSIEANAAPGQAEAAREGFAQGIPMKRYGEPEEIAELVLFLGSDRSKFISGSQYSIDGGMSAT
ncbi:SDR family NAD(P)-dependent oxidoreductase [Fictibacillus fluitans]|uniref:Glucose 1-dehydrogenase n=1 Tax=Fictibacillus fluitans TaxID=3058422 RepID=A0ABT8HYL4_9BACL|nr:glucose 1-dehydrogenase [Fictibacillus sp. NE201]MDN4525831.1 glucose 1-dehydrogenase [Fictibacillus sp. NE201]